MAILNTNTSDSNARLVQMIGQPQDAGFKLVRSWPWLSVRGAGDTSAHANDTGLSDLITAINATTSVTNPKVNTDTYTGTFIVSEIVSKDEDVEGTGERKGTIVQTLTKVKTVTTVGSMGTPDKGADKETLNYLGFQEGTQEHVYHIYRNLNPDNRDTTMALVPTETGYTIVKREWKIETDKTATFYVVFEKDTWPSTGSVTWTSNKKKVGYINYDATNNTGGGKTGGSGLQEEQQLTGLSQSAYPTQLTAALSGDANRVATNVTLIERKNGEYAIHQRGAISYASTSDTAAHIETIQSSFGGIRDRALRRVWARRTYAAKETLIGGSGKAVSDYVLGTDSYRHDNVNIQDNHDGTFDVIQTLGDKQTGGGVPATTFFADSYQERKRYTRSKDDAIKQVIYARKIRAFSSEGGAHSFIRQSAVGGYFVVNGSARISKRDDYFYVADWLLTKNDTYHNRDWA